MSMIFPIRPCYTAFSLSLAVLIFLSGCVTPARDEWKPFPKLTEATSKPPKGERGHVFPNVLFKDQDGKERTIADYRGKVVFLNFWASWCQPCQQEMPGMQRLYNALKSDDDFAFLILNIKEDYDTGVKWARNQGYTFPLSDSAKVNRNEIRVKDGGTYHVRSIPDTFILDRSGVVVAFYEAGHFDFDLYVDHMLELAGKPPRNKPNKTVYQNEGVDIIVHDDGQDENARYVRLSIVPKKPFKLAAGPGVVVTAEAMPKVEWLSRFPMTLQRDEGYFETPPEFRIGFSARNVTSAPVIVDYAYCETEGQCYLRTTTVDIAAGLPKRIEAGLAGGFQ